MRKHQTVTRLLQISTLMLVLALPYTCGAEDLSKYGEMWDGFQKDWQAEVDTHQQKVQEIKKNTPAGPERNAKLKAENARHRVQSKELAKTRDVIHQKVVKEVNRRTAGRGTKGGGKGAPSKMKATKGTKVHEPGHQGVKSDFDAGGNALQADTVQNVLDDMNIKIKPKVKGGTVEYGNNFDFTVNKNGQMGTPGSSAHQTQVGVDARNVETFVSETMEKGQPARKAVEVQDNIKKAQKAYEAKGSDFKADADLQKSAAKSTKKIMETDTVPQEKVNEILEKHGIEGDATSFKEKMDRIKEGKARPDDITPENAEKIQKACKDIAESAAAESTAQGHKEIADARKQISELEAKGDPASRQKARELREKVVDSQTKLEETRQANREMAQEQKAKSSGKAADADGPGRTADVDGPGGKGRTAPDADGPGRTADVDGPGKTADVDGPGGKGRTAPDADGPGRTADVDGPGKTADIDGPGAPKGKMSGAGKVLKAAGDYMEGTQIINQAGKIRKGIKEGDSELVAEGVAGEDLAKRTRMEGAKGHADDMGTFMDAKSDEAVAAAAGKLKRMGATQDEIDAYQQNVLTDPAKARQVVQGVKARGGKDTAPQKALDTDQPTQEGWTAKEQLTEGAKQAGDYLVWGANALSGGFTGKGQAAVDDSKVLVSDAGKIDDSTKTEVQQAMIKKLAGTGEVSVDEARRLVEQVARGDREEFDQVVADLREQGAFEKTKGKYGLDPSQRSVEIPDADYAENAKETAETFKEELIDKPADFVTDTANDLMEMTGIGSAKNESEQYADEKNAEFKGQYGKKVAGLIKLGATPEEAKAAVEGKSGAVSKLTQELRQKQELQKLAAAKAEIERAKEAASEKEAKAEQQTQQEGGDKRGLSKEEADRKLTEVFKGLYGDDIEGQDRADVKNDAGESVDPDDYAEGDTIVTSSGTEYEKTPDGWRKTGNEYDPHDAGDDAPDVEYDDDWAGDQDEDKPLDAFVEGEDRDHGDRSDDYRFIGASREITRASRAANKSEREARNLVNKGGADASRTMSDSARTAAEAQRADSWGTTLADAAQKSVEEGVRRAASTLGTEAAARTSSELFDKKPKQHDEHAEGGGEAPAAEALPVADADPPPASEEEHVDAGDASDAKDEVADSKDKKDAKKASSKKTKKKKKTSGKKGEKTAKPSGQDELSGGSGRDAPATSVSKPAPKPKPKPPPAPKGKKCACCGGHNTYFSNSHALYGDVYKCRACSCTFHDI